MRTIIKVMHSLILLNKIFFIRDTFEICGGPHVTQHTYGKDDNLYVLENAVQFPGYSYCLSSP